MSLTDKAKEVTGKAVAEAKKGAAKVQEKVENVQLRQKANGLAKEIGYLVVKEKGGEPAPTGEIDRLVAEIASIEEQIKADRSAEPSSSADAGATS
jgi:seryl-tRNA synthetase